MELRRNTGERGTRKFIAYQGIVYDVTDCPKWRNDLHEQLHFAGQDLTSELPGCASSGRSLFPALCQDDWQTGMKAFLTSRTDNMSKLKWWQTAVFYQIYPRSFADGNGDGIGDFKGMTEKLDYLADLGVDAIWLSPHFPSPNWDCGYDVSDYCNVAPEYGTLEDFKTFLAEAHRTRHPSHSRPGAESHLR